MHSVQLDTTKLLLGIFLLLLSLSHLCSAWNSSIQLSKGVIQTPRVSYRKSRISSDLMSCAGQRAPVCSSNPQPRELHCNRPSKHHPTAALGSQTQLEYLYTSLYAQPNVFVYFCEAIMGNATENV